MFSERIGRFELKAYFDEIQNELVNEITFLGEPVSAVKVDAHLANQYIGYGLILTDLKHVVEWADAALELLNNNQQSVGDKVILRSLFVSIMTTYWKCFAQARGRNGIVLDPGKFVPKEQIYVHNEIQRIRNNYTAHSGEDPFESGYVLLVKDNYADSRFSPFLLPIQRKASNGDLLLMSNVRKLSLDLIERVEAKQESLLSTVRTEYAV